MTTAALSRTPRPGASAGARAEISFRQTLAFGVPAIAMTGPALFIQFYLLNFATDVLLIAPAVMGAILAGTRIWDAVSDPAVGYLSDRTRSRLGRRRPWMLAGAPAAALAFVAVWSPPAGLGGAMTLAWLAIALLAFTTAATCWSIPQRALGAELSDDPHVRSRIFGTAYMAALTGAALSFGGMQIVANAADPRTTAVVLASAVAVGMAVLLLIPPLALRERPEHQGRGAAHPVRAVRDVLRSPHARRLLFVWFVDQLGLAAQGSVAPFMTIYILERPDLMGVMPAFFIGPLIASVPIWIRLSRRFGRKRVWLLAMLGASVSYLSLAGIQADDLVLAGVMLASAGFFTGCGGPIGPSLLAAVIDDDERRTGERKEGVYFAAWAFVEKLGGAVVVLVVGMALQLSGFEPNQPQGPAANLALRACLGLLPCVMFLAGALAFRRFSLTDE